MPVSIGPSVVSSATDLAVVVVDGRHSAPGRHGAAVRAHTGRVPLNDRLGARVAVERAVGRGEDSVELHERTELAHLVEIDEAARDAELVLQCHGRLEVGDVAGPIEQEEVADLVEVDLCAGALFEPREGLDAAEPDRDVERVRELSPKAASGAARRSAGELVALDEADVDAGFGQVERGARADDTAPDDDDVRRGRERRHRRTRLRRKKPRLAGRSASRRMRYGYQSGPNGVATSTL